LFIVTKHIETMKKLMTKLVVIGIILFTYSGRIYANPILFGDPAIEGRWDITVDKGDKKVPSWLDVRHSGNRTLVGYFVSESGSARPVSKINFKDGKLNFSIPPQWEDGENDFILEGSLNNGSLSGTITSCDGKKYPWTGVRAPSLVRTTPPVWGNPVTLFNGKNTDGWYAMGPNQWMAKNGILTSEKSGSNLVTKDKFSDFKLHIEFRYPKESNSGIYLRGRYEVQVSDSYGKSPLVDEFGAVYGFIIPTEMAAKMAGEWQAYDITLIGRFITVVANGKTIICNQEIPGITGGALDSNEGEPGPIYLQGDHGPVEYRNIVITPAKN
jgi:hypothetical protein